MRFTPERPSICEQTPETLKALMKSMGQPGFRAGQLLEWVWKKRAPAFGQMLNLPKSLREALEERFTLNPLERVLVKQAGDVTEKLLLRLEDGALIETVLIRQPQKGVGQDESRKTVCVSTQVGCAYGCKFCASGLDGWKRDLTAGEIAAQLLEVCRLEDERNPEEKSDQAPFDNIVVMGMGEPLANYDSLLGALRAVNAEWGLRFGARRITVSTSGLAPQIRRLAQEPIQFRLAISLHGPDNETRSKIMPVNRKHPLEELIPAARFFAETHGRMLTLEYILINELNDSSTHAERLAGIAEELHAHVNLIPYNRVEGLEWERPSSARQEAFAQTLGSRRISCTLRKEKGHDIDAACGQLRLRKERE